jgi:hypothetical protein
MVDLALLQSISYIAGALGVCVAAAYYVMNLNETRINRRIALTNSLMYPIFHTEEGMRRLIELGYTKWSDYGDFKKKYDSSVNPDHCAKRLAVWNTYDAIGRQYRLGLLDSETVYNVCNAHVTTMWVKYKSIIEEYRRTDYGRDTYSDFEFLAMKMMRIKAERDPMYTGSASIMKVEDYSAAFKR